MEKAMTGEQFLNSIRHLDNEIDALDLVRVRLADQRQDILDRAESISTNLSGVCVQQSVTSKTETLGIELASTMNIESLINRLNDFQELINKKIDVLVDQKREAVCAIERIAESKYRTLLIYRYIDGLKWSTIADLMGYTEAYVRTDIKDGAIATFESVWEKAIDHKCVSFLQP